jgi:hypothetical protein
MDKTDHLLEKKYPKSKNNFQCLGPCYKPNTWVLHPITLEHITDEKNPFCAVNEWEYIDEKTGKKYDILTDACHNPTDSQPISKKELEMNIIIPTIDFNSEHFLKIYYKIFCFDDTIKWLEDNTHAAFFTKKRILECSIKAFSKEIYGIDEIIVDFYIGIIKKSWLDGIIRKINKYINIDGENNISFQNPKYNNISYENKYQNEKRNYVIEKFINSEFVEKFLTRFIQQFQNSLDEFDSLSDKIKTELEIYIEHKILKTLKI